MISELVGVLTKRNPYSPPPLVHPKALLSFGSTTITNLQVGVENQSAARSRIMDADFASETANMSRAQVLHRA